MRVFNALVITVALTMMLTPSVNADIINPNLIINGSFENPDIPQGVSYGPVGGWAIYYEPILGWTPTTGGLEIQDRVVADVIGGVNLVWLAYNGDQFAELDAYGNGGMSQTVNTISDQKYNFSFAYSPRPGPDHVTPDSLGVEIYFNDMLIDSFSLNGIDLTDPLWSVRNYTLTATGTSSTFKFIGAGISDGYGVFIDDVQLHATADCDPHHPVPEPSTMLLLGSGLAGLVGYGRRRLKK